MATIITQTSECRQCGLWGDDSLPCYASDMCGYCSTEGITALVWTDAASAIPFEDEMDTITTHAPVYSFDETGIRVRDLATGATGSVRYRITRATGEFYLLDLDEPMGPMGSMLLSVLVAETETVSDPKSLMFETVECRRCSGRGHIPSYSHSDKGVCYSCSGRGRSLTAAGHAARKAYNAQRRAVLAATYRELEHGTPFWYDNECMVKDAATDLRFQSVMDVEVMVHDGAAVRKIWIAIAAGHRGATLKY